MKQLLFLILVAVVSTQAMGAEPCNDQAIRQELREMRASAYWRNQFSKFAAEMNKDMQRNCSFGSNRIEKGFEVFMDDLEFTGSSGKDRVLARSGRYGREDQSRVNNFAMVVTQDSYREDGISPIDGVSTIQVRLTSGSFSLRAETCSPKVALAYLNAYTPYALTARCGEGRYSNGDVITTLAQQILKDGQSK